jgi:dihydrofolate reductase
MKTENRSGRRNVMKLTVTTFITLDGVMQGPGGPDEDRSNGFELGGWLVPFADEGMGRAITDIFTRAEDILLGRNTYDMMYPYWSTFPDQDDVVAAGLNNLPKHVATSRPESLEWTNSHPITGDLVESVARLKERPGGELQVHGSHGLLQTLIGAGLVDEFNLFTYPVVLGAGKRLFESGTIPMSMRYESSVVTETGVVIASYTPIGPPTLLSLPPNEGQDGVG